MTLPAPIKASVYAAGCALLSVAVVLHMDSIASLPNKSEAALVFAVVGLPLYVVGAWHLAHREGPSG